MTGYHTYKTCIEACLKCAAICNHCASSCTQEENIEMMARCIQLDMECAAICYASKSLVYVFTQDEISSFKFIFYAKDKFRLIYFLLQNLKNRICVQQILLFCPAYCA
jgi:hypothetical protein